MAKYLRNIINIFLFYLSHHQMVGTFKVITLASAIEEKKVDLIKDRYYDSGKIKVENATIHCWKRSGHGSESFLEVVENSCNPGFVILGQRLGKEKLMEYIKKFGFGEKTGIDLSGESKGIIFNVNRMGPVELATTAFGQGVSVSAIQQVMGVSAAINGGNLMTPYILSSISDPTSKTTLQKTNPILKRKVISEETSKTVRFALESVVSRGTGHNAYINNYSVGGKTGTAQKVKDGVYMQGNYILSFIGFMPADNPKVIVYVAIDHPKGVTQYGGTVAAPIAKNILASITDILDIPKSKSKIVREYQYGDTKYYEVPDVTGLELSEARKLLSPLFAIETSGKGTKVITQSPKPQEFIKQNGKVRLLLK